MVELVPSLHHKAQIGCPLHVQRPRLLHIYQQIFDGPLLGDLYQIQQDVLGFLGAADFLLGGGVSLEQSLEADLCGAEGQLIIHGVYGDLLLLDVAGLPHPHIRGVFFEGMDADLLLLLGHRLRLLLHELDILKIFHLLVNYLLPETKPYLIGNAEVVDSSADCVRRQVLSLARACSACGRYDSISV